MESDGQASGLMAQQGELISLLHIIVPPPYSCLPLIFSQLHLLPK